MIQNFWKSPRLASAEYYIGDTDMLMTVSDVEYEWDTALGASMDIQGGLAVSKYINENSLAEKQLLSLNWLETKPNGKGSYYDKTN